MLLLIGLDDPDGSHMGITELHRRACERFGQAVGEVRPEQWELPTPCTDWNVRALVNHLLYEDLWTPPMMAGRTIAEVGDRFVGDLLGDDPVGAYDSAAAAAMAAVGAEGALSRTVHPSFGDVPGEQYAWQLFADHLIHAWDLASSIGADEDLGADLVRACTEWFTGHEAGYRAAGAVGPRPDLPPEADPQSALLAAFGRAVGERRP